MRDHMAGGEQTVRRGMTHCRHGKPIKEHCVSCADEWAKKGVPPDAYAWCEWCSDYHAPGGHEPWGREGDSFT
jgi:hypothetical protein